MKKKYNSEGTSVKVIDITGKLNDYVSLEEFMRRTAYIEEGIISQEKIDEMKVWSAEEQARYLCPNGVMTLEEYRKILHDMIDEVYNESKEENEQK